jgi:hypothetical protein
MVHPLSRKWFSTDAHHQGVLLLVIVVELVLFAGFHWDRWTKSLPTLHNPATATGEGLVVRSDGLGYYAWLRSLLIDRDWSFDNEFDEHNPAGDFVPPPSDRTESGRRANQWSIGPACLWSTTVVPGHLILQALERRDFPWPADGYSLPYQLLVGCTTLLISWVGFFFLYGIGRQVTAPSRAALAAALLTLGTNIVYYSAIEVTMAHGIGTAVVAALVWYWLRTYHQGRAQRWFLVGLLIGAAALVRWQLVTLALLPAGEALLSWRHHRLARDPYPKWPTFLRLFVAAQGAFLAFLPQMIAWRCVYGRWLVSPLAVSHNWMHPQVWQVLFGQDRGLLYWTPLGLVALLASLCCLLPACGGRQRDILLSQVVNREPVLLLSAAFLVQVYVLASLWGTGICLGVSFGFRHLTEVQILLAPGLALLLERTSRRGFLYICTLGCVLVLWNSLLVYQFRYGRLPADAGANLSTMLQQALHLIRRKHLSGFIEMALAPALLWLLSISTPFLGKSLPCCLDDRLAA